MSLFRFTALFRFSPWRCAAMLLPLLLLPAGRAVFADTRVLVDFAASEYRTPGRIRYVLTPDLNLDGWRDLCIVSVDSDETSARRFISIVRARPERGYPPEIDQTWEIDPGAIALCLGDFTADPGLELGCLTVDGLRLYRQEPDGAYAYAAEPLIRCPSFYQYPEKDEFPLWHDRTDLDGDGRDDCYLPRRNGYSVFLQRERGAFATTQECDLPATSRVQDSSGDSGAETDFVSHIRSLPRLDVHDYDGDGRKDFVALDSESLVVFLQGASGEFPREPSLRHPMGFLKDLIRRDAVDVALIQLGELNGDGLLDLLLTRIHGEIGVFESMQTDLYLFLGRGKAPFAAAPDQTLHINGVSIPPQFVDIDGDGRRDFACSALRTDLWKNVGTALLRRFEITYYLFLFGGGKRKDRYPENPSFEWTVSVSTEAMEKGGTYMPRCYFNGDFDGDHRLDLMQITGEGRLAIRRGREGVAGLFRASTLDFTKDELYAVEVGNVKGIDIVDLDADGRSDIVLRTNDSVRVLRGTGVVGK